MLAREIVEADIRRLIKKENSINIISAQMKSYLSNLDGKFYS